MRGATERHRLSQAGMTQVELAGLPLHTPRTVNRIHRAANVPGTPERLCGAPHVPATLHCGDDTFQEGNDAGDTSVTRKEKFPIREGEGMICARGTDSHEDREDYGPDGCQREPYQLSAMSERPDTESGCEGYKVSDTYDSAPSAMSRIPGAGQVHKGQKKEGSPLPGSGALIGRGAAYTRKKDRARGKVRHGIPDADSRKSGRLSCLWMRGMRIVAVCGPYVHGHIDAAVAMGGQTSDCAQVRGHGQIIDTRRPLIDGLCAAFAIRS